MCPKQELTPMYRLAIPTQRTNEISCELRPRRRDFNGERAAETCFTILTVVIFGMIAGIGTYSVLSVISDFYRYQTRSGREPTLTWSTQIGLSPRRTHSTSNSRTPRSHPGSRNFPMGTKHTDPTLCYTNNLAVKRSGGPTSPHSPVHAIHIHVPSVLLSPRRS